MSTKMEAGNLTCITSIEKLRIEEEEEEEEEKKTLNYLKNATVHLIQENDNLRKDLQEQKNTTAHLIQENDNLKKGLEEQKESQLQANVTIIRLERDLEVLQKNSTTQLKKLEEHQKKLGQE